jgi:hypothetical protein
MALEKVVAHISSYEFWRTLVYVGKGLIRTAKIFLTLSFLFTPLLYLLHFIRALLRVVNYKRNTKNKNLGETRKLLFSLFKILIAAVAFGFCFFMSPVPVVFATAFLLYSTVKLLDSTGVLVFSIVAHFKINKNSSENQWRRAQYWDNIIKHTNILVTGVTATLLFAIVLAGGVAAIVWISPVMLLTLAITAVVTVVSFAYLSALIHQYRQSKTQDEKAAYRENIKKFAKIFAFWLVCLTLVGISFLIPGAPALGFVAGLLFVFNVYDLAITVYFYFKKPNIVNPEPVNTLKTSVNSLEYVPVHCYYAAKNPLFYLKKGVSTELSDCIEVNHLLLVKQSLLYLHILKNKLHRLEKGNGLARWMEKSKIAMKIEYVLHGLAKTLKNENNDCDYLISLLLKVKKSFDSDMDKLAGKSFNLNTMENINYIQDFTKDLAELIKHHQVISEIDSNANNLLLSLFLVYNSKDLNEDKQPDKSFHQSFFRKTGQATLFWRAFQFCQNQQQEIKKQQKIADNNENTYVANDHRSVMDDQALRR